MPVTPTVAPGARNSGTLDVKRQERRRNLPFTGRPDLVHDQPRHSQRGLLSARRQRLHARPSLIVTGPDGYFSEEKNAMPRTPSNRSRDGVPAYRLVNTAIAAPTGSKKRILADPARPACCRRSPSRRSRVRQATTASTPCRRADLVNAGMGNTAWVGDHKGKPVLFASDAGICLALASSLPWAMLGRLCRLLRWLAATQSCPASLTRLANARRTAMSR